MKVSVMGGYGIKAAVSIGVIAVMALAGAAHAQDKAPQSAWVKLCENTSLPKAVKGGKTETITKNICLTHHERLDGNTGMVIISAAIRHVEGEDKKNLMVMVPLGMALPPGVKAAVYTKEQWARAEKKEEVKDSELKPLSLKYSFCHAAGCTAEVAIPDNMIGSMQKGGGLMVLALNASGRPVAFPIPLVGFTEAHKGKPVDNAKYSAARQRLMGAIRERMRARIAKRATGGLLPEPKKN